MGGPRLGAMLVFSAFLVAACGERQSNTPTAPEVSAHTGGMSSIASCDFSTVATLTETEFGEESPETGFASDMQEAGAQTDQGTLDGYKILSSIGTKYEVAQPSTTNASALTVALLSCMTIGGATIPGAADFDNALGAHGAFEVRGLDNPDNASVFSHDGDWVMEPPAGTSWQFIIGTGGLGASTDPAIKFAFLAFGSPGNPTNFTNDVAVSGVFDWATIPVATFAGGNGVVVGECAHASNYVQHLSAGTTGVEVLGFVSPSCAGTSEAMREVQPRNLAERLFRALSPEPAAAAILTTTGSGGSKRTLSPFEVIFPSSVGLTQAGFQWNKKANKVNVPFNPTPVYTTKTGGGTPFLQDKVLLWLVAISNTGTNVKVCNNWAYTNATGTARFTNAFLNKAGGFLIRTFSAGTAANGAVPTVPASAPLTSPLFNVKNNGGHPACLTFTPSFDANGVLLNPPPFPGPNP